MGQLAGGRDPDPVVRSGGTDGGSLCGTVDEWAADGGGNVADSAADPLGGL